MTYGEENVYLIDGRNYCRTCGGDLYKQRKKEIKVNTEMNDYLFWICGGDKDLMPFLCRQVRNMKDENGWKTESILAVLKYIFEITDDPPELRPEYGIRYLVESNFYEAKKYFTEVYRLKKTPEERITEIINMPPREIVLKRSEIIKREKQSLEKKKDLVYGPEMDMDDIEEIEFNDELEVDDESEVEEELDDSFIEDYKINDLKDLPLLDYDEDNGDEKNENSLECLREGAWDN